ncbi:MAG TPA: transposase [Sumerlaeia bacterium]|nr:transposase [Sumerlaeia bacterium]
MLATDENLNRGTAEQCTKEGKVALTWTRLSCHEFRDNEVRLQLFALAYNLGNFLRRLALPRKVKRWSLTTLREKCAQEMKTAAIRRNKSCQKG